MPTTPHPTLGVTNCARCGARIRWAAGPEKGQRTPLNALPSPAGGLAARTDRYGGTVVRTLDAEFPEPQAAWLEWKAVAHWSSCTGGAAQQPVRSRPARRRPSVQPPLFGQQPGRGAR